MPKGRFELTRSEFDYSGVDSGNGYSGFGLGHPRGLDLRPDLPATTHELIGVDLTHTIHAFDVAAARGGPGGGGGGGGGGGLTFANYVSGPANAASGYNITIEFKGDSQTLGGHNYQYLFSGAGGANLGGLVLTNSADTDAENRVFPIVLANRRKGHTLALIFHL